MTKIAELKDKGAVVAWSPLGEYADVIALGSKVCISSEFAFLYVFYLVCLLGKLFSLLEAVVSCC
jgi:hypothetical protein